MSVISVYSTTQCQLCYPIVIFIVNGADANNISPVRDMRITMIKCYLPTLTAGLGDR
jgi:hypothetical protein